MFRLSLAVAAVIAMVGVSACSSYPENPKLPKGGAGSGYRFDKLSRDGNTDSLFVIVTFSGGGTRAAALSYGVLEKLRDTKIKWKGQEKSLLDEVDVISSVSGGSFTSAYYGLFRDGLFTDFKDAFLYKDIQGQLLAALFNPVNLARLASPTYGRIDLASELYDREIFRGRKFEQLIKKNKRPYILLNATDMATGSQFTFVQPQFDLLCSDLSKVHVARAVAASSNFPIAFTPLTLDNHAGGCGYEPPGWITSGKDRRNLQYNPRVFKRASVESAYYETTKNKDGAEVASRPYIHLLDGGVSDNIGLRRPLNALLIDSYYGWGLHNKINKNEIEKFVVIIVDAGTVSSSDMDNSQSSPGIITIIESIATIPLDNYSFDTVDLMRSEIKKLDEAQIIYSQCEKKIKAQCPSGKLPSGPPPPVDLSVVYVGFVQIDDNKERAYFQTLPTSFSLPRKDVDNLTCISKKLLEDSKSFKKFLKSVSSPPTKPDTCKIDDQK